MACFTRHHPPEKSFALLFFLSQTLPFAQVIYCTSSSAPKAHQKRAKIPLFPRFLQLSFGGVVLPSRLPWPPLAQRGLGGPSDRVLRQVPAAPSGRQDRSAKARSPAAGKVRDQAPAEAADKAPAGRAGGKAPADKGAGKAGRGADRAADRTGQSRRKNNVS